MPISRSLTLIAPQIAPALAQAAADAEGRCAAQAALRWPQLARLAGRAGVRCIERASGVHAPLSAWQSALLAALGCGEASARYPSAAVTRIGEAGEVVPGYWMHAEPVHLAAGLADLSATLLSGPHELSGAEREALAPTIAAHLRAAGFGLSGNAAGSWLVRGERELDLTTAPPEVAAREPLQEAMPRGRDAGTMRRLMTELQMLLHEHPVNLERQRRGLLAANAIWFHGEGATPTVTPGNDAGASSLPQAFGEDPYLRGIYRLHGSAAESVADAGGLLARLGPRAVAVVGARDLDTLEAVWLKPLARALLLGRLRRLQLVLDRWYLAASSGTFLKLWRGGMPPARWPTC